MEVVGEKSFIGDEDIKKMTYLDMVIKETLRINPPAPNTFRESKHDMVVGGYKLPAGTCFLVCISNMIIQWTLVI